MSDYVLTVAQMRRADEYTIKESGVPSEELMRRAGLAIAAEVKRVAAALGANTVTVVCGAGNNGGDGFVCARELLSCGFDAEVYALGGKLSPDCEREKSRYKGRYTRDITGAIAVDCIFGTGLSGKLCGEAEEAVKRINASDAFVISADIPSGLNGDNGLVMGVAVKADETVAIAELKTGCFLNDGQDYCGDIVKADIGIKLPPDAYTEVNALSCPNFFPARKRNTHKGSYGTATLVAGSEKYAGAAALAAGGALKSGCGLVKLVTHEKVKQSLAAKYPQVIYDGGIDLNSDCVAIGPGLGVSRGLYDEISRLLSCYGGKLVIDADGLNALSAFGTEVLKDKKCEVVLTPHIKEFSRLTGLSVQEISQNPLKLAGEFAREYGVTLILKSSSSVICGGGKSFLNVRGTTALAKGGSGDMLAGFLCGTLARGLGTFEGAVCAAQSLGLAAEIASVQKTDYCATARDILKNLHFSVKKFIKSS